VATIVSERKGTETKRCDGCRELIDYENLPPGQFVAVATDANAWSFHKLASGTLGTPAVRVGCEP
jgi:hypothetical protein